MNLVKELFFQDILGFKIKHDSLNKLGVALVLVEKSHSLYHLTVSPLDNFLTVVGGEQLYKIM